MTTRKIIPFMFALFAVLILTGCASTAKEFGTCNCAADNFTAAMQRKEDLCYNRYRERLEKAKTTDADWVVPMMLGVATTAAGIPILAGAGIAVGASIGTMLIDEGTTMASAKGACQHEREQCEKRCARR